MKCSIGISNFLELSSFPFYCFPLFFCIDHCGSLSYLSLLFFGSLHSNGCIFPFLSIDIQSNHCVWNGSPACLPHWQYAHVCSFVPFYLFTLRNSFLNLILCFTWNIYLVPKSNIQNNIYSNKFTFISIPSLCMVPHPISNHFSLVCHSIVYFKYK